MVEEVRNRKLEVRKEKAAAGKPISIFYFLFSIFYLMFFVSCAKSSYKSTFVIAGSYLEVISPYKNAGEIVHEEFKRLGNILSAYDSQAELYQLNQTYNQPCKVSPELIELLELSRDVYKLTDGAFDVSCGSLYAFWKELINKGEVKELPSKERIAELKDKCGMDYIEIDKEKSTVMIKKDGLKIDLNGIAIGYIIDRAVMKLKERGIDSALINHGGDIYCLGKNKDKSWRVGIKDPSDIETIMESEEIVNEAITTSGNYEQFFELGGKRYSHLIDPKTGFPVDNGVISVSVITKNCTSADSLATGFFVMGLDGIKNFLSKVPSTMRIFVVTVDKKGKNVHIFR